ncbi:MAG: DNA-formamidopyrimidine glycosylase [Synechococcales bacterium]|nr:DNA-formamidopyrimidine glycosylase [Synechococcales bacterium]
MPELPEVETVRRGLNQTTLALELLGGDVLLPRTVAHPLCVSDFLNGLSGTAIAHWHRRGKYLLAALVDPCSPSTSPPLQPSFPSGGWLGVHLRMTGQLLWIHQSEPVQTHCRVRLYFPQQRELRFVDQRTFGRMWWVPPGEAPEVIISGLQRLGPEPLSAEFSVAYLKEQLRQRQRPIKTALLDQAIIAGIGNIYADEALFLSHIKPVTLCSRLKQQQIQSLHDSIVHVLQTSIAAGGTSFSTFRDVRGINGNYGQAAWVYGREGEPCRTCHQPIQRLKLAGRSTYFCPHCQR